MRFKSDLIMFLFLFLTLNCASAQLTEIRGKITDSKSGESMVGVHITIRDDVHGTISGSDGNFNLKTSKKLPITIRI